MRETPETKQKGKEKSKREKLRKRSTQEEKHNQTINIYTATYLNVTEHEKLQSYH